MGTSTLPDIDVDPTAFDTTYADEFVAQKYDRDAAGNLRTAYPRSSIVARLTAGWGNAVDDTLRSIVRRLRGSVPIGTNGDTASDPEALLSWLVSGSRVQLLNAAANAYRTLHVLQLWLGNGARILDLAGSPEGVEVAGRGSLCLDTTNGAVYVKTTTSGNTGWSEVGAGQVYREEFGFDTSSSTAADYASFTSSVIETDVSGSPRALNVWRAPFAGTITRVHIVHESNANGINFQWYETDGSTTVGASVNASTSSFTLGAGTGYQTGEAMAVTVTEGQLLTLGLTPTAAIGEANCWLELTPS